jgi:hypothetical protein
MTSFAAPSVLTYERLPGAREAQGTRAPGASSLQKGKAPPGPFLAQGGGVFEV